MRLPSTGKDNTDARLSSGSIGTVQRYESFVAQTRKHRDGNDNGNRLNPRKFESRCSIGSGIGSGSGSDSASKEGHEISTKEVIEKQGSDADTNINIIEEALLSPSNAMKNKKKPLSLVEKRAAMFTELEQKQFVLPEIEVKGKRMGSAAVKVDAMNAKNPGLEDPAPEEANAKKEMKNVKVPSPRAEQRAAVQKNEDAAIKQTEDAEKPVKGTIGSPFDHAQGDEDIENKTEVERRVDQTNEVEINEEDSKNKHSPSSTKKIFTPSPSHMDFQSKKKALINFASGRTAANNARKEIFDSKTSRLETQHRIKSDEGPNTNQNATRTSTATRRESSGSSALMRSPSPSRLDFASKKKAFLDFAASQQNGAYNGRTGANSRNVNEFCPDVNVPSASPSPKLSSNPLDDHHEEQEKDVDIHSTELDCHQIIPSKNETESHDIIISIESIDEVSEEESDSPIASPMMTGFHTANIDFSSPLLKPSEMQLERFRKPNALKSTMDDDYDAREERSPHGNDVLQSVSEHTPSSSPSAYPPSRPSMESEQTKSSDGDSLDHIIFPGTSASAARKKHNNPHTHFPIQHVDKRGENDEQEVDDSSPCNREARHLSSHFDNSWCGKDPATVTDQIQDGDDDDDNTASIAQFDSQAFETEAIEFGMDLNAFQREIDMINAMTSPNQSGVMASPTTPSAAAWSNEESCHSTKNKRNTESNDRDLTNYHRTIATPPTPLAQSPFLSPRYARGSGVRRDVFANSFSDGQIDTNSFEKSYRPCRENYGVDAISEGVEMKLEDKRIFEMQDDKHDGDDNDVEGEILHVRDEYPSKVQLFQESLSPTQLETFASIIEKRDLELKFLESQNRSKTVEVDLLKVELIDQHKQIQELLDEVKTLRTISKRVDDREDATDEEKSDRDEDDFKENDPSSKGNHHRSMHRELIDLRAKLQASEATVAQLREQHGGEERRDSTPKNGQSAKKSGGRKKAKNTRSLKARVFGKQLYHA